MRAALKVAGTERDAVQEILPADHLEPGGRTAGRMSRAFTSPYDPASVGHVPVAHRGRSTSGRSQGEGGQHQGHLGLPRISRRFRRPILTMTPATAEKRSTGGELEGAHHAQAKGIGELQDNQDRPTDCIQLPTDETD